MTWQPYSLNFRQRYEGGYRYLDACGALMVDAEKDLRLVPVDAKPNGAKLELPEAGIKATLDTTELKVAQEAGALDETLFLEVCVGLERLVQAHCRPSCLISNGFARQYLRPMSADDVLSATLGYGDSEHQTNLGRAIGMVPAFRQLNYGYASGSRELTVRVAALTFERVTQHRFTAPPRASAGQRELTARRNRGVDQASLPSGQAICLSTDLVEHEPPAGRLVDHFQEISRVAGLVMREIGA